MAARKLMPQSPTSISTFNLCPRQYQAKYITKEVKFESTPATERGTRWHLHLEERLRDKKTLPEETAHFESLVRRLELMHGEKLVETMLAVNSEFKACDYKVRYVGGKVDACVINHADCKMAIFDYKTGKVKDSEDFRLQLKLYALAAFAQYPHIQHIRVAYIFLDHFQYSPIGEDGKKGLLFTRADVPILEDEIKRNIDRIKVATEKDEWIPNPNPLCKVSIKNGGKPWCQVKSCPFWGK